MALRTGQAPGAVRYHQSRAVLASAGLDGPMWLWDPVDGVQLRVLTGHPGGVLTVSWGRVDGGPVLASAGYDGTVRLWGSQRSARAVIRFENPLFGVSASPDGWLGVAGLGGVAVLAIHSEAFANPQTAQRLSFSAARPQR
jgi:WD40 repeat protein